MMIDSCSISRALLETHKNCTTLTLQFLMNLDKQAAIAYIAALSKKKNVSSFYDYNRNKYCFFSNRGSNGFVNVYDQNRNNYITGYFPSIYDYSTNSYIQIDVRDGMISGFDYGTSVFFTGNVFDTMVCLFVNGQYYNYSFV